MQAKMSGDFCHVIINVYSLDLELQLGLCVDIAIACFGLGNKMMGLESESKTKQKLCCDAVF